MNPRVDQRPDPDRLLKQVEAEERDETRGRLKVFLGYASGTGKTFRLLDEGRRRRERGQDVVIAAMQATVPPEAEAVLKNLETVPARQFNGVPVIDVPAVLRRRPQVCLIDGLAYDNPPGSRNPKRWQDVQDLLKAGISVLTSINLNYIEEYRDKVEAITGKRVSQTVPVAFLNTADEIAIVDAPEALNAGSGLSELRELALLATADVVDRQLAAALNASGIQQTWGTQERIMVCVTPRANAEKMVSSAKRNVERFHGELYAVHVTQAEISPEDQEALNRNLEIARKAGARIEVLDGVDPADAILNFAKSHAITQIFIGHSRRTGLLSRFASTPVDHLLERAGNIDVRVFPQ